MGRRVSNEVEEQAGTGSGLAEALVGVNTTLPLSQILYDERNNMRHFQHSATRIQEYAHSIRENGLLQNLVVTEIPTPNGDGYTHVLRVGFGRYRALRLLEEQGVTFPIPVKVIDAEELGAKMANLSENMDREDLSPINLGYALKELTDGTFDADGKPNGDAMTHKEIATRRGIGAGRVSELIRLTALRPEIQKRIHSREVPWKVARVLITQTEEEQDRLLADMERASSPSAAAEEAAVEGRKKKGKKAQRKAKLPGDGVSRISTKAALGAIEEISGGEGVDGGVVSVLKVVAKFLEGKIGVQAFANQLGKALA